MKMDTDTETEMDRGAVQEGMGGKQSNGRMERAFALYCQGMRMASIAATLGASESSVRRWVRVSLSEVTDDERALGAQVAHAEKLGQVIRAIESQRAIASAAWDAYTHERAVEEAILRGELDRVRRRVIRMSNDAEGSGWMGNPRIGAGHGREIEATGGDEDGGESTALSPAPGEIVLEEYERPKHPSQGARYLTVALVAQREVARLQGLYEHIERDLPDVHITLTRQPAEDATPVEGVRPDEQQ